MEYKIIRSDDSLMHYGVPGMKWGVRKQREYSGGNRRRRKKEFGKSRVLSNKEKQKYYSQSKDYKSLLELTDAGLKFNNASDKKKQRYKDSVLMNLKRANPNFKKEYDNLKYLHKKNSEDFEKNRQKWLKNEGEFKGLSWEKFREKSYDLWIESDYGKKEAESKNKIRKMVSEAAKEHPLFDKTYERLSMYTLTEAKNEVSTIKYGETVINELLNALEYTDIKI